MLQKPPTASALVILLLLLLYILPPQPAEAGCLNCTKSTTSKSYEENDSYTKDTGGSLSKKTKRLDDEIVEKLFTPILFGVSLDDITSNFGDARDGGARRHEGLDMLAPRGTPIVTPTEAVVTDVGTWTGAGKYVTTANPGGETFEYMHLNEIADIERGDVLDAGDLVGYVGKTGNARNGPAHLHFEIRDGRKAKDPYPRITKELSLKQKMQYLEEILDDHRDEDKFAEFLIAEFEPEFIFAQSNKVALPDEIED